MKFNDGIGNSEERGPIKTLMIAELAEGEQASEGEKYVISEMWSFEGMNASSLR